MGANHQKEINFYALLQNQILAMLPILEKHIRKFWRFWKVIKGKSELYDYLKQNNQTILVNEADKIQVEKTEGYSSKITFGKKTSQYQFEKYTEKHFVGLIYKEQKAKSNPYRGIQLYQSLCCGKFRSALWIKLQ